MRVAGLVLAVCLASCRCSGPQLEPIPTFIRVTPSQHDFGRVFVGGAAAFDLEVLNAGKAPIDGVWALTGAGFHVDDGVPTRALIGSTLMTVRCAPTAAGVLDGVVTISLSGFEPVRVPLSCEGIAPPECPSPGACRVASWSAALSRCVEADAEEGTPCGEDDVCLEAASCRAGRCEGRVRSCDDGDPCTADTCHPERGCETSASVQCPGDGACRVGRCEAGVGCGLTDAPDGTPCGPTRTCTVADVCIAGECVQRDPPDGFVCAAGGPCGGEGRCVNDACVSTTPAPLRATWEAGSFEWDGGVDEAWSDLYAHRDGGLTLSSYFMTPPRLSAETSTSVPLAQSARRCIAWLGWDVCGDFPPVSGAPITAIEPRTGVQRWSYARGRMDVPRLAEPRTEFFLARLAVLNENELLVLYEARTFDEAGVDPRCRWFVMVVLDRQGQHLRSRFIEDPIFDTCNHQHSYGVAVDAQANIYLGFTASSADNPAISLQGTTIFSFSSALQPRWRRHLAGLRGGDLAVADGLLFHEKSDEVLSTANGSTRVTLPAPFGLGVIGDGVAVMATAGGTTLRTLQTSTLLPGPTHSLNGAQSKAPLAVATWQSPWGPRDVALVFTEQTNSRRLEAIELQTGAAAFACELDLPELPLMSAVTPGAVTVMLGGYPAYVGWPRCDDCDPRYARTRSRFLTLPLPGLTPSSAPWSGGWGNEGHTHREGR